MNPQDQSNSVKIGHHNIAVNSINSFNSKPVKEKRVKVKDRILEYLRTVDCASSRTITKALKVERCTVSGLLRPMQKAKLIIVKKSDFCPITKRVVYLYSLPPVD